MKNDIASRLAKISAILGLDASNIRLDHPENLEHGDLSSNIAMVNAKKAGTKPRDLADKVVAEFRKDMPAEVESIDIAGPGFINFRIKDAVFAAVIKDLERSGQMSARIEQSDSGKEILVEYTDPNTFKVFHIGHMMSNAVGESIARLIEKSGAKVVRICYASDIGLHIAKSIWAMQRHPDETPEDSASIQEKTDFLGRMYVEGTNAYAADVSAKDDIDALNKILYERSSPAVDALYSKGRRWSIEHFGLLYETLGTKFDEYIYESEMASPGLEIVKDFLKKGVFQESEGAVVFKGERFNLHTRVFISSAGIPTYEAKEIGLNVEKFKRHPGAAESIIITASEQNDYFKVLVKALELVDPDIGKKTRHIGHGMMRFASGKMSSRTGNVVTAESLMADMEKLVADKIADRKFSAEEAAEIAEIIAVGAIKYSILRSSIGSDIIFDTAASISFEGDSGPYLQYSAVRAASILEKAKEQGIRGISDASSDVPERAGHLERLVARYPDVLSYARAEFAPQAVASYLVSLAAEFNSFYASQTIIDPKDPLSPYRVALSKAFLLTMTDGLGVLGIKVPKKM